MGDEQGENEYYEDEEDERQMIDEGGLEPLEGYNDKEILEDEDYYRDTKNNDVQGIQAILEEDEEDFESMYETSRSNDEESDFLMDELYEESLLSHKRRSYFFMVLLGLVMGVLVL